MLCGVNPVLRRMLGAWKVGATSVHSLTCLSAQASPHHAGPGCPPVSKAWCRRRAARGPPRGPWLWTESPGWAGRLLPIQSGSADIDGGPAALCQARGRAQHVTRMQALPSGSSLSGPLLLIPFWVDLEVAVPASCPVPGARGPSGLWPRPGTGVCPGHGPGWSGGPHGVNTDAPPPQRHGQGGFPGPWAENPPPLWGAKCPGLQKRPVVVGGLPDVGS